MFTDQLGNALHLKEKPNRIISLVPSQTELLWGLGLDNEVVGITKFCIHPESWFKTKSKIGGTKQLNLEKIAALEPDLIIGNKEENNKEQIEWLSNRYPVWMSDINTLADALNMIQSIGALSGTLNKAEKICQEIEENFNSLERPNDYQPKKCLYLIWDKPFMAAGKKTFINEMMQFAGFQNSLGNEDRFSRYPELSEQLIEDLKPEVILLSSEPFPFTNKHLANFQLRFPDKKIYLVDGEMFSWYGSRLLQSPGYFQSLINELSEN